METRRSQASLHSKCDKTIGVKVLIAAPAARPVGKLKLIQFFSALCPKAHPSQTPLRFSSAKKIAPQAFNHLMTWQETFFMVQVQVTESFQIHREPCGVRDCKKYFFLNNNNTIKNGD